MNGIREDVFVRDDVRAFLPFFPHLDDGVAPKSPTDGTEERVVEGVPNRRKQYFEAEIQLLLSTVPTQKNQCEVTFRFHFYL